MDRAKRAALGVLGVAIASGGCAGANEAVPGPAPAVAASPADGWECFALAPGSPPDAAGDVTHKKQRLVGGRIEFASAWQQLGRRGVTRLDFAPAGDHHEAELQGVKVHARLHAATLAGGWTLSYADPARGLDFTETTRPIAGGVELVSEERAAESATATRKTTRFVTAPCAEVDRALAAAEAAPAVTPVAAPSLKADLAAFCAVAGEHAIAADAGLGEVMAHLGERTYSPEFTALFEMFVKSGQPPDEFVARIAAAVARELGGRCPTLEWLKARLAAGPAAPPPSPAVPAPPPAILADADAAVRDAIRSFYLNLWTAQGARVLARSLAAKVWLVDVEGCRDGALGRARAARCLVGSPLSKLGTLIMGERGAEAPARMASEADLGGFVAADALARWQRRLAGHVLVRSALGGECGTDVLVALRPGQAGLEIAAVLTAPQCFAGGVEGGVEGGVYIPEGRP